MLKIEVSGPKQPFLSVVDVPGLFHTDTIHQTRKDLGIVRNLIKAHMNESTSIMLWLTYRWSHHRMRCSSTQLGDEKEVLNIAQNKVEKLKHGWFLAKNRSIQDLQEGVAVEQRDVKEKVISANLLLDHIRKEIPALLAGLEGLLAPAKEELKGYDIHDIVKSYYKLAMKRFLDNVVIQVVERHVLGPNTPLRLFSPDFVDDMDEKDVTSIAAESSSTTQARSDLSPKLERLQNVLHLVPGDLHSLLGPNYILYTEYGVHDRFLWKLHEEFEVDDWADLQQLLREFIQKQDGLKFVRRQIAYRTDLESRDSLFTSSNIA
ncbi:hypothetical protein TSTA_043050 [Talaromyces stipitatus ATCC 10500]|uniref:GED domain-containing protein n=1 Tax=Talaromyces stipitatus (strain ATCC 10500 / CBS 375.48 / QM 6759 / NRRL 1006) TaxID=441959 RepID=B8MK14_TALSN|nr:uncharacterized protein TSTA_043050 [Talaromyces stipitatus ATCC 10500]EED14831.1 hypothetical protein TSTA_043050 [Talaromyces stipitatus ATCC 10500]